jgi:16S rRNA (cytidine1402-2'-O)-methyltransferase
LEPLTIFGFVPARAKDRKIWWERVQNVGETLTFFETPHRIDQTLKEIPSYFGDRPILVARELTKRHQQLLRFDDATFIGQMPVLKGEFTVVVGPRSVAQSSVAEVPDELIYKEFWRMTIEGHAGRRQALSAVAVKYGRSAKYVYSLVERYKKSDA